MRFHLVMRVTNDDGTVQEHEWLPEVVSESRLWCDTCQMVRSPDLAGREVMISPTTTRFCGYCEGELKELQIVECPRCGGDGAANDFIDHLGEGCEQ